MSLRYCYAWFFALQLCCPVRENLPCGGVFVSYPLAVSELEMYASPKRLCLFECLPV
jgi:hypothetical protein